VVNIYKHAFTFWHRPGIEPGTFRSQVGHSNHYSTTLNLCVNLLQYIALVQPELQQHRAAHLAYTASRWLFNCSWTTHRMAAAIDFRDAQRSSDAVARKGDGNINEILDVRPASRGATVITWSSRVTRGSGWPAGRVGSGQCSSSNDQKLLVIFYIIYDIKYVSCSLSY